MGKIIDVFKPELVEEKELIAEEVERWKTEGEGYWTIKVMFHSARVAQALFGYKNLSSVKNRLWELQKLCFFV